MDREPLTIHEATESLGVSDKTIRRMLDTGILKEHSRDPRGRILIDPRTIDAAAVQLGRKKIASDTQAFEAMAPSINAITEATRATQEIVTALVEAMREKDRQMLAQAEEIGRLKAERQLLPAQAEVAQERIAELERRNAEQQAELERLRSQLSEVVQPPDQVANQPEEGSTIGKFWRRLRKG
jgi:hypothetical protein